MTLDLYYNQNYGHVKWEATTTFNSNRFHWMCCSSLECSAFVCVCVYISYVHPILSNCTCWMYRHHETIHFIVYQHSFLYTHFQCILMDCNQLLYERRRSMWTKYLIGRIFFGNRFYYSYRPTHIYLLLINGHMILLFGPKLEVFSSNHYDINFIFLFLFIAIVKIHIHTSIYKTLLFSVGNRLR